MKSLFLFSFLLIISFAYSQDLIIRNNGDSIFCRIISMDSSKVYFNTLIKGKTMNTSISKANVSKTILNYQPEQKVTTTTDHQNMNNYSNTISNSDPYVSRVRENDNKKNCVTIGILHGGGGLIGLDFEHLIADNVGIQGGVGLISFGAGLNFHFAPTIRSSFISIQYYHQGIGAAYTQSIVGPTIVFRGKKWFTANFGLGFAIDKGPAWPRDYVQAPMMLLYGIGAYIPL